jgi:cobalt/nickel transport system permease protein
MNPDIFGEYRGASGSFQRIDVRVKIAAALLFIILAVSTPARETGRFAAYYLLVLALIFVSRIPPLCLFKRVLVVIPFTLLVALSIPFVKGGDVIFLSVLAKSMLSVLLMALLVSSTGLEKLLSGLRGMGVPRIMLQIISFMCRYLSVIAGEIMRMQRARDSRSARGNLRMNISVAGNIIGTLFIRSYERAERVYSSMVSRGYSGEMKAPQDSGINARDALSFMLFACAILAARFY